MASEAELAAMLQAITLSSFGLGTASPNPPVGCVILDREGVAVGAGYHRRKGEPHAEVNALEAAGNAARGGTAVVTLEPCNHIGVTPACRQELINAGIARVVISVMDPTSRGEGGAAVLAAKGVDVETNVIPDETLTVLGPWLAATTRRRPYLTWAYALGDWSKAVIDQRLADELRSRADLLLGAAMTEEGLPGGHAPDHFSLPNASPKELRRWLSDCYDAGSRSVLVVGDHHFSAFHDDLECVDEIVIAIERASSPEALAQTTASMALPGFKLAAVSPGSMGMRVRLRRSGSVPQLLSPRASLPG